jgi:HAD superfamily hydrolase (TIGR01509 family)
MGRRYGAAISGALKLCRCRPILRDVGIRSPLWGDWLRCRWPSCTLTVDVLIEAGLTRHAAEAAVATVWRVPDPITSARPLADLTALFRALRARGIKIAIATMDDRASSQAGLAALGVVSYVEALVCADDGWPPKPAPEMAWAACRSTGVMPSQAVVVGDSMSDMQMGRRAGAGLVVGVLSGVSPAELLAPHADALLYCVADLI